MRITFIFAALLYACGGTPPASEPADESTTVGDEEVQPVEPEPEPEPEVVAPSGPGHLRVANRVGGEEIGGNVQVLDESGEVVAEGSSGETFDLPAGSYALVGEVTDATILLGTPTTQSEDRVTLDAGSDAEGFVDHGRALVRIRVTRNNRNVRRWRLELTRRGSETTLNLEPTEEYVPVTPGRYDGVVHFGSHQIEVTNVIFQDGARRDLPIRVN